VSEQVTIEERLTRTLTRAAELAVPNGSVTMPAIATDAPSEVPSAPPTKERRRRRVLALSALAAGLVVIGVVAALVVPGSPTLVPRTQLAAAQAQQLVCGGALCPRTSSPSTASGDSNRLNGSARGTFGGLAQQGSTSQTSKPTSLWIFASHAQLQSAQRGQALPVSTPGTRAKGVLYVSADGDSYRFVTPDRVGELKVTSHHGDTVILTSASGARYDLNLSSLELSEG
jgi:hypothetical protein